MHLSVMAMVDSAVDPASVQTHGKLAYNVPLNEAL